MWFFLLRSYNFCGHQVYLRNAKSTYGAATLEIYSTCYHNNYGNCNFIADSLCDSYIFCVNESIQFCLYSGETLPVKADFSHT